MGHLAASEPANLPAINAGWTIAFRRVSHRYPSGRQALTDVSFATRAERLIAIVGPSGAGKSTLLRLVNGLLTPSAGSVRTGDVDLSRASPGPARRLRRQIGMIFQEFALVSRLSVLENVLLGRLGYRSVLSSTAGWIGRADRDGALQALERVGMADFVWSRADQLSGGQRQRVGIAAPWPRGRGSSWPTSRSRPWIPGPRHR